MGDVPVNQNTAMLADRLHAALCNEEDSRSCRRWASSHETGVRHRAYYNERAEAIMGKLEPEIGAANVLLAIEVISQEVL